MSENMRQYSFGMLKKMQDDNTIIKVGNAEVHIKHIPDCDREGEFEPRLAEKLKQAALDGNPNQAIHMPPLDIPAEKLFPAIRQMVEVSRADPSKSKTIDLCDGEIQVTNEEVALGSRKIKLWQYHAPEKQGGGNPCFVHIHGGGFFMGSPNGKDPMLKFIAEKANANVFDVDYSLTPEMKFPAAIEDCYNVICYLYDHAEQYGICRTKIAVGGGSAGGNLSAAVALKDRDSGERKVSLQLLMNPATMMGEGYPESFTWSANDYVYNETSEFLRKELEDPRNSKGLNLMFEAYATKEDSLNPYCSPAMAKTFVGLPKAIIITSEFDSLRQGGEWYGGALQQAGVDATVYRYNGIRHEDMGNFGIIPQAEDMAVILVNAIEKM